MNRCDACFFCQYDACDICVHGKELERKKREAVERLAEYVGISAVSSDQEVSDNE